MNKPGANLAWFSRRQIGRLIVALMLVTVGFLAGFLYWQSGDIAGPSTLKNFPLGDLGDMTALVRRRFLKNKMTPITPEMADRQQALWERFRKDLFFDPPPTVPSPSGYGPGDPMQARVVVLGLDGATWKVLNALLAADLMPNLERFLVDSSFGLLQTDEAYSPISWTTIATGKLVNKTLHYQNRGDVWGYQSSAVLAKRWWEILGARDGGDVALVDYYYTPSAAELPKAELYQMDPPVVHPDNLLAGVANSDLQVRIPIVLTEKILREGRRRYIATIIRETDSEQHECLPFFYLDYVPRFRRLRILDHALVDAFRADVEQMVQTYQAIDRLIGLLRQYYSRDYVFIVSDHGFRADVPRVLIEPTDELWQAAGFTATNVQPNGVATWMAGDEPFEVRWFEEEWGTPLFRWRENERDIVYYTVASRRYTFRSLRGDPDVAKTLYHRLLTATFKWNSAGLSLFDIGQRGDQVALRLSPETISLARLFTGSEVQGPLRLRQVGNHHEKDDPGVIIMRGPGIALDGQVPSTATVADIVPTLLYLKNYPVGADMDGRVLQSVINPAWLASRPVRTIHTHDDDAFLATRVIRSVPLSAEMLQRLRTLGYL